MLSASPTRRRGSWRTASARPAPSADLPPLEGVQGVEADEIYTGGLEKNKHSNKKLRAGRGAVGKTAAAGIRDRETGEIRAQVVERIDGETPRGFVEGNTAETVTSSLTRRVPTANTGP